MAEQPPAPLAVRLSYQIIRRYNEEETKGRLFRMSRRRRERIARYRAQVNDVMLDAANVIIMTNFVQYVRPERLVWQKERSKVFWEQIVNRFVDSVLLSYHFICCHLLSL